MSVRVGLLECDHVDEELREVAGGDYADMFARLLGAADPGVEMVGYDAVAGVLPATTDECDGWLLGGSRRSTYDDDPWIHATADFVRAAHATHVPVVGVCFGHQLLAQALGGRVQRAGGGWGVGVHTIDLSTDWSTAPTVDLLFMHQDQIVALPDGGTVIGSTEHCPVAVMTVGDRVLGIQAHPEFSAAYEAALLDARVERIGVERTAAAKASLARPVDRERMGRVITRFLRGDP